jgi:NAD+ synthase (glutamine-hydrolysing)
LVPKTTHPNYGEFYEQRWFSPAADISVEGPDSTVIDHRQIFDISGAGIAIEICEDLWAPEPPGIRHCLAGADLVLNLSASNELVAKADYRRDLVTMASARGICGYLYASSGALESSKDIVFGGHLLAAENGQLLAQSDRFSLTSSTLITEFDLQKLRHDRMQNTSFQNAPRHPGTQRVFVTETIPSIDTLYRRTDPHPFVPADETQFDARATEILNIQATGLARRVLAAGSDKLVIGLSGGLDSTLAFLVCVDAVTRLQRSPEMICALTLPGPGTSEHTLGTARQLASALDLTITEIPITAAVNQHLNDLDHSDNSDVVFENAQARERTQILFNYANKVGGIVVGTGDLSELALGWCTYKTMITYLVRWYARHRASSALGEILARVLETPISPELIAPSQGRISQETEAIIGPYELHDFFLFHLMRNGEGVAKIFDLANLAFSGTYQPAEVGRWLSIFIERFFTQQFKRTTLPPGPKVGSVSLSPRGDWRMPDEVAASSYLEEIDALIKSRDRG